MSNLVSIIVPIYKVEPYLRRCLDSIVNQTYTNLEIILVDDGSPDGCPQICDEYAANDNRIVVIHKENGGLSDARNAGLDICKGEYIFFIDSDDFVTKNCIETFLIEAHKKDNDVIIAQHAATHTENDRSKQAISEEVSTNLQIVKAFSRTAFTPCAWNKLYKAKFIKSNHLSFFKGILFEDQLWSLHWITQASKICLIPHVTYIYNTRTTSIMNTCKKDMIQSLTSWKIILNEYSKHLSNTNLPPQLVSNILIQKIEESLNLAKKNFFLFRNFYKQIQHVLPIQKVYGYYKTDSHIKNILYCSVRFFPSLLFQILIYIHIKIKC